MRAESLCGFLIGESLGTGLQPLADTHGIRCCGIDQGLRDVDTLSVVSYFGDEVLWNHGAPRYTAEACYPKAFAMRNAAEAARPPTITVWAALRTGLPVVNKPLI